MYKTLAALWLNIINTDANLKRGKGVLKNSISGLEIMQMSLNIFVIINDAA